MKPFTISTLLQAVGIVLIALGTVILCGAVFGVIGVAAWLILAGLTILCVSGAEAIAAAAAKQRKKEKPAKDEPYWPGEEV